MTQVRIGYDALFAIADFSLNEAHVEDYFTCASAEGFDCDDECEDERVFDQDELMAASKFGVNPVKYIDG